MRRSHSTGEFTACTWRAWSLIGLMLLCWSAHAQYEIAERALLRGDFAEAWLMLKPMADAGDPRAQHDVGLMYAHGLGVSVSYDEAARWLTLAAAQGNVVSKARLGWMYYHGHGVRKDLVHAMRLSLEAAQAGDAWAQCNAGFQFFRGEGTERNTVAAAHWYRQSALQGFATCQRNLALLYEAGEGVKRDLEEAYAWLGVAAAGGDPSSVELRDRVGARLDTAGLERARARARELFEAHGSRLQP